MVTTGDPLEPKKEEEKKIRDKGLTKNKILETALFIIHTIRDEGKRANLLSRLLPNLSGPQRVTVVLAEIQTMLDVNDIKKEIDYQKIRAVELPRVINYYHRYRNHTGVKYNILC